MRLIALLFSLFLSVCPLLPDNNSNALADLGIDARVVSQEEADQIVKDMQIERSTERFDTGGIQSLAMDPSYPEYFYIGFDDNITNGTYIECFTIDETYQFTIQFHLYGSYHIFCSNGMLFLYIVRGSWLVSLDQVGNVAEVYELNNDNSVSNDEVLDNLCNHYRYTVDGKTFEVGNNSAIYSPFQTTYSNLKVTNQDGSSHYLYQTSDSPYWTSLILILFMIVSAIIMISKHVDDKRENGDSHKGF